MIVVASFQNGEEDVLAEILNLLENHHNCKISYAAPVDTVLYFEDLIIDPLSRSVIIRSENVGLTSREFSVLYLLAKSPGRVYTKEQIYEQIWDDPYYNAQDSITSMVNRIRQKIEPEPRNPKFILTVWGTGYKFNNALKSVDEVVGG